MANSLVKKTRKPRDPFKKVEKTVTHINEEQFILRHQYCIYAVEIKKALDRDEYVPANYKPYCDHPEDGVCGTWISPEELRKVNERLAGRGSETSPDMSNPVHVRPRQRRSEPKANRYFCMKCEEWHQEPLAAVIDSRDTIDTKFKTHAQYKRKRGQRLPSQLKPKEPAKYFCTKCNDWHFEDDHNGYTTHLKYKRKRGRQKGWQLTANT